jgi:hypothetical protein
LLDLLTVSILLVPLIVIPLTAQATHWSWLMLLCVPVAFGIATLRHRFELDEWLARDLASTNSTTATSRDTAETIDVATNAGT